MTIYTSRQCYFGINYQNYIYKFIIMQTEHFSKLMIWIIPSLVLYIYINKIIIYMIYIYYIILLYYTILLLLLFYLYVYL